MRSDPRRKRESAHRVSSKNVTRWVGAHAQRRPDARTSARQARASRWAAQRRQKYLASGLVWRPRCAAASVKFETVADESVGVRAPPGANPDPHSQAIPSHPFRGQHGQFGSPNRRWAPKVEQHQYPPASSRDAEASATSEFSNHGNASGSIRTGRSRDVSFPFSFVGFASGLCHRLMRCKGAFSHYVRRCLTASEHVGRVATPAWYRGRQASGSALFPLPLLSV